MSEKDAQDQGIAENTTSEEKLLLTSLFCVSIINYLVFLVWSEVSHYFIIIGVVVQHLLIADATKHIMTVLTPKTSYPYLIGR